MLLLSALFVAGCSAGPGGPSVHQGGTLYMSLDSDPTSLNPLVANDPVSARAYAPLFPLLYAANRDLSVGPDLAAGLPALSDSGKTLTVSLRTDAKWSDGMPITADDVVFTVGTETDPMLPSHASFHWAPLKSVSKVDQFTVKFTLTAPDAAFVANSLVTPIVPQHALQGVASGQMAKASFTAAPTVTGGPFKFDHRAPGQAIYLNSNPNYFLGNPHIDHIVEMVTQDPSKVLDQLENGKLSWVPMLAADSAGSGASAPGVMVAAYPALSLDAVMFNVRAGRLFAEPALRQAFASSIGHDSLVSHATGNAQGYAVSGDINPYSWAYSQSAVRQYAADSGRAHDLLSHDGWTVPGSGVATRAGRRLAADIIFPASDASRASAATDIAAQTKSNGFNLTPKPLDDASFERALTSGGFDAALVALPMQLDPDESTFLASSGPRNYGGYSNPSLDALLNTELGAIPAANENVQQARKDTFEQIEQVVFADVPLYCLWVPRVFTGFNAAVGGVAGAGVQLEGGRADTFYRDWYLR